MAAEAQGTVQRAVEQALDSLEKEKLRPLLRKAHLGSAKCCENQIVSKEQLEQCMQATFQPAQHIQQVISRELNQFQDRLSRCAQQCQDNVQDQVSPNTTAVDTVALQAQLDKCITTCCNSHIELLPRMMMRINENLQQFKNS